MLTNPDFKLEATNKLAKEELDYRSVFANYSLEEYQQAIDKTTVILENEYQSKYLFLRALSFLNKDFDIPRDAVKQTERSKFDILNKYVFFIIILYLLFP